MHNSSDGINVKNVRTATMLQESEPAPCVPGIVIRISLGDEAGVAAVVAVCVALAADEQKAAPTTNATSKTRTNRHLAVMKSSPPPVQDSRRTTSLPASESVTTRNWKIHQ